MLVSRALRRRDATDPLPFASFYAPVSYEHVYVATSFMIGSWNTGATIVVENMTTTNACTFGASASVSATPYGQASKVILYTGHSSTSFRYVFVVTIGA